MNQSRIITDFEFVSEITDSRWSMLDAMGVELETAEFLYSMVRLLKPPLVIETGTYPGVATEGLWRGVVDNGYGFLTTYETNPDRRQMWIDARDEEWYRSSHQWIAKLGSPRDFDAIQFCFLDSEPSHRQDELDAWCATAPMHAICAYHDIVVMSHKPILPPGFHALVLPSPRGVWLIQKG